MAEKKRKKWNAIAVGIVFIKNGKTLWNNLTPTDTAHLYLINLIIEKKNTCELIPSRMDIATEWCICDPVDAQLSLKNNLDTRISKPISTNSRVASAFLYL